MPDQECRTCRFFLKLKPEQGECHRREPRCFPVPAQGALGGVQMGAYVLWPPVQESQWCGEYEPHKTFPKASAGL